MTTAVPELNLFGAISDFGNPSPANRRADPNRAASMDPAYVAAQRAAASQTEYEDADRRRRASLSDSLNPTGAMGDTSTPNLAAKSLLGQ